MSELIKIITSQHPEVRNQPLDVFCREATDLQLFNECAALDKFRRESDNLYERVRALFFLYSLHRFHLPPRYPKDSAGNIPFEGVMHSVETPVRGSP